jgi:perosamine synthetase
MGEPAFLPYGHQSVDDDDIAAVVAVLRSDWLTTGPAVDEFEAAVAAVAGTRHAVAVSSGTAALHAGYAAFGLGPGAGLVTSPLSFAATATAALHLGARVGFADIEPATGNIDPAAVAAAVTRDTRLVVATDFAGHPADYAALEAVTKPAGIELFADAAHSFGASVEGRPATRLVAAAATSFHPVKAVTTGEGGAFLSDRDAEALAVRQFRNHGIVRDRAVLRRAVAAEHYYEVQSLGLNYRMPDVLAALGTSQLGKLARFLARRRTIAARYTAALAAIDTLEPPVVRAGVEPSWHLYVLRVHSAERRDPVFAALRDAGLGVQVHYAPIHTQPLFEDLGFERGQFPLAEDFAARAISLPLFPAMSDADVDRVIETVADVALRLL